MKDALSLKPWVGGYAEKPDWTTFFLAEAFLTAQKSIDTSTAHGCVWVSNDNRILSKGYNGPLRGSDDEIIPMTRPDKYYLLLHSEENCILNYNGSSSDTENSIFFVTGRPCHKCLRMILQKGVCRIVHGPVGSQCVDEEDMRAQEMMLKDKRVAIEQVDDMRPVADLLLRTISYIKYKCPQSLSDQTIKDVQ